MNLLNQESNIIVYGVGHSGTSVLTKMVHALGWQYGSNMDEYHSEDIDIRDINQFLRYNELNEETFQKMKAIIETYPKPFVVKDPRFIWTLHQWQKVFEALNIQPLLLNIEREFSSLSHSYNRRPNESITDEELTKRMATSRDAYNAWPHAKTTITYSKLKAAAALFDPERQKKQAKPQKKGLFSFFK